MPSKILSCLRPCLAVAIRRVGDMSGAGGTSNVGDCRIAQRFCKAPKERRLRDLRGVSSNGSGGRGSGIDGDSAAWSILLRTVPGDSDAEGVLGREFDVTELVEIVVEMLLLRLMGEVVLTGGSGLCRMFSSCGRMSQGVSYGEKADTSSVRGFGVAGVTLLALFERLEGGRWICTSFGFPGPINIVAIIYIMSAKYSITIGKHTTSCSPSMACPFLHGCCTTWQNRALNLRSLSSCEVVLANQSDSSE
jgi:hypothetical protein